MPVIAYLYFIRFSLVLWLTMILFVVLDAYTGVSTATRGILTLDSRSQFFWAAFFVALAGWVALLSARIVCAYGKDRFDLAAPPAFKIGTAMSWRTFLGAQIPGFLLMLYVFVCSRCDGRQPWRLSLFILLGAAAAFACWCCLTAFYYWTYQTDEVLVREERMTQREMEVRRERRESSGTGGLEALAVAMPIFAPDWIKWLHDQKPPAIASVFDSFYSWVARHFGVGYGKGTPKAGKPVPLNSGLQLAILTLVFLLALYFSLCYFTAPVEMPVFRKIMWLLLAVILGTWIVGAIVHYRGSGGAGSAWQSIRLAMVILLPIWILDLFILHGAQTQHGFPVLAMIYVLLIFVFWGLGGLAFFFDRFRVPVVTTLFAAEILLGSGLQLIRSGSWQVEHIVQTQPASPPAIQYPDKVLASFLVSRPASSGHTPPLVIVTATGGGIHAAAWASQVLALLEEKFQSDKGIAAWNNAPHNKPVSFHNSILLMSSASGGSVGFDSWLREYLTPAPFASIKTVRTQITQTTECSGLEGVAWGLIYPDAIHLLAPFRIFENYDRGWALQAAIQRNRFDERDCEVIGHGVPADVSLTKLVSELGAAGGPTVPAFSLNATVAETGDRLLIANYHVRFSADPNSEVLPADSFLDIYRKGEGHVPDLTLEAAARLSATFPYVSPMPRVARDLFPRAYHFADGGYYDNDGTATVMEFLAQAYCLDGIAKSGDDACKPPEKPLKVILIEIRDGENPSGNERPDQWKAQSDAGIWNGFSQLMGPPSAFLNAGHGSVTRRNRNELCVLEKALPSDVELQHYVFDYVSEEGKLCCAPHRAKKKKPGFQLSDLLPRKAAQPLNWRLTPADRDEISLQGGGKVEGEIADRDGVAKEAGTEVNHLAEKVASAFALALKENDLQNPSNCETILRSQ